MLQTCSVRPQLDMRAPQTMCTLWCMGTRGSIYQTWCSGFGWWLLGGKVVCSQMCAVCAGRCVQADVCRQVCTVCTVRYAQCVQSGVYSVYSQVCTVCTGRCAQCVQAGVHSVCSQLCESLSQPRVCSGKWSELNMWE